MRACLESGVLVVGEPWSQCGALRCSVQLEHFPDSGSILGLLTGTYREYSGALWGIYRFI